MIPCVVEQTPMGCWYLTFPCTPEAGLLFDSDGEKVHFAAECGIDLDGYDLLLALDLGEINQCPEKYFLQAKSFQEVPF